MDLNTASLTQLFGNSPLEIMINCALITALLYLLWRVLLLPLFHVATSAVRIFQHQDLSTIELIPPAFSQIDPKHTESLIAVIQRLHSKERLSLEVTGSKERGISYRILTEKHAALSIKKQLSAYLPEFKFRTIKHVPLTKLGAKVYTFKQARHFAFPLKPQEQLAQSDIMSFIAGSMTQLGDNEQVSLQLVVRRYSSKKVDRIYNGLIKNGHSVVEQGIKHYLRAYIWVWLPGLLVALLARNWAIGLVSSFILLIRSFFSETQQRPLTIAEEKIYSDIIAKLDQPLLRTDIRFSVHSPSRASQLVNDFISSLQPLNKPGHQAIRLTRNTVSDILPGYLFKLYDNRLSSIFDRNATILSSSELASLFHFPYGVIKTEGMVRSHSKTLPATLSLRNNPKFDVVIGVNKHHDTETLIGLTSAERERHMYIIGGTGSGKTTMLRYQIIQDMRNGKGLAVIDPHGDLAEELLSFVPKEREKDLIYLNPDDLDHPLGVNLLELQVGLTGNDLLKEKDRVTESVVSVMRKIFSEDDSGGHRIEYVLRNTIQTALTMDKPTLFTIFRLLNDGKFAKRVVDQLEDEDLKAFWRNELGKAGGMQKVKMTAGITAKIGRFLFSASARAMLEQENSDIDFSDVLNGKIFICNFSKGRLGEDTSMLFGTTILAKLQLAALKRSEEQQSKRIPFYLYVDEFQNFATVSFTQMLSEARKYKFYLTMAEQSTQQQDDGRMVEIILANVGTVVTFRTGSPKDEQLILPKFEPYVVKGEISNLPAYNFYCRISGLETLEPLSGETLITQNR